MADSPQAPFTALSMLGSSAAGQEKAILPEDFNQATAQHEGEIEESTCSFSMVDWGARRSSNQNKGSSTRVSK